MVPLPGSGRHSGLRNLETARPSATGRMTRLRLPALLVNAGRLAQRVVSRRGVPLAALIAIQWLGVAILALRVEHNGWLYFQGGDQTWHYTSAWLLSDGILPSAVVGYVWPALLSPVAAFAGPNVLVALPAIVVFQVVVLLPITVACVYGIGGLIGGRAVAIVAATAWVAVPYAAIPLFDPRYHERYVDQFLPQALGLTAMSDFPGMVALLVAAYFGLRTLLTPGNFDALVAGLAAGIAVGIKPSNLVFVPPVALALAVARRWRPAAVFLLALVPALVTLTVWKKLGLGYIPALAGGEVRFAAGAMPVAALPVPAEDSLDLDWSQLAHNEDLLREFFWSVRLLEWTIVAGVVAAARRSPGVAVFLGGWLLSFLLSKGTSELASVETGSFFRLMLGAFPAFLLLAASVPLLFPRIGSRLVAQSFAPAARPRAATFGIVAVLLAVTLGPLPAIGAARSLDDTRALKDHRVGLYLPVSDEFALRADPRPNGTLLRWEATAGGPSVFYRVLRAQPFNVLSCDFRGSAPDYCVNWMDVEATVRGTSYFADDPPSEGWVYRIAMAASWADDENEGDMLMLSFPVSAAG